MTCLGVEEVALYVAGTGSSEAISSYVRHVESCESCRKSVAAAVRAARSGSPPPPTDIDDGVAVGTAIGRYIVAAVRGSGATSHVFEATDPDLGRTVAIKVVRNRDAIDDARALREGRALAKLAHQNVVTVHDVGVWSGGVFLAMELVRGSTVREWATAGRHWREVARVFADVARGLAAAHRAGLVHRDIKPDNIVIDGEGRVRVIDFGLAVDGSGPVGSLGGTPAYLAPELLDKPVATPRTDQYAFMVSLYEALEGTRPGERVAFTRRSPGWLRAIIERGLATDPEQRFGDLEAVARALDRGLGVRKRRVVAGAAAVTAVALVAGARWSAGTDTPSPCVAAAQRDPLRGAWDVDVLVKIEAAFLASKRPFAGTAIAGVGRTLDAYANSWIAARVDACEATHVRRTQSSELLDLRNECLDRRLTELRAFTSVLATADAPVVDQAMKSASALVPVAGCADTAALRSVVALPADPAARREVAALRTEIAAARALHQGSRYKQALAAIDALAPRLAAAAHGPVQAEALLLRALLEERVGDHDAAAKSFTAAALAAESSRDDTAKAQAMIGKGRLLGTVGGEFAEATEILEHARATVKRVGTSAELESRLENALGSILFEQAKFAEGIEHSRRALALAEQAFGKGHVRVAREQLNLASSLERTGDFPGAKAAAREGLAVLEHELGPSHPDTAMARGIVADVLFDEARYDEALVEYQRELADLVAVYGDSHRQVWAAHNSIGMVHEAKHELPEALAGYQRALAIIEAIVGPDHIDAALQRINIGNVLLAQDRFADAIASYRTVIAIAEKSLGRKNQFVAHALNGIGEALREQRKDAEALPYLVEALAIFRETEGAEHPDTAMVLGSVGEIHLYEGQDDRGFAELEESLRIRVAVFGADHPTPAATKLVLGSALWAAKRDRKRGRALVEQARAAFQAAGDDRAADADAWLAKNR